MKIYFVHAFVLAAALLQLGSQSARADGDTCPKYSPSQAECIVGAKARGVVEALRDRHMGRLATFAHPTKGLQFSPYAHATKNDRKFSKAKMEIRKLGNSAKVYKWGSYDGTGGPIKLSWRDYFFKFVYCRDFAAESRIRYNSVTRSGNTIFNLHDFYSGSIFVEYFTPDPAIAGGNDWQSLYLIFQPRGKEWYLVGIAHGQWTI